jgi:putative sigma-54 modulation protein
MNVNITFRHMDHTPALDQLIREKSEKFSRWLGPQAEVLWTCWAEGVQHFSEVSIHFGPKDFFAKAHSDDLYKSIDLTVHKIQNQLH